MHEDRHGQELIDEFTSAMRVAKVKAGVQRLEDIKEGADRYRKERERLGTPDPVRLPTSTLSENLKPGRSTLSRSNFVIGYITVLRFMVKDEPDSRERLAAIGTVRAWEARWKATKIALARPEQRRTMRRPTPAAVGPAPSSSTFRLGFWWDEYVDVVPDHFGSYLNLEPAATNIRTFRSELIPELLQTPEYAEEMLRAQHVPETDLARHLALRTLRQRNLLRPGGPRLWAILAEPTLRTWSRNPEIMRRQLAHLVKLGELPKITLQVISSEKCAHFSEIGSVTLLRFVQYQRDDLIYIERRDRGLYPGGPEGIAHYNKVLGSLAISALRPEPSVDLLRHLIGEV